MLLNEGFKDVFSMVGGISAWNGMRARGIPEAGMTFFSDSHGAEEYIALAWTLEDGSEKFYSRLESIEKNSGAKDLYGKLLDAEGHHKASLERLFTQITGKEKGDAFPWSVLDSKPEEGIMEGGMKIDEAIRWLDGKDTREAVELLMSLEVNSYDLYMKVGRSVKEGRSRKVFLHLADEEKQHLDRLSKLLEALVNE